MFICHKIYINHSSIFPTRQPTPSFFNHNLNQRSRPSIVPHELVTGVIVQHLHKSINVVNFQPQLYQHHHSPIVPHKAINHIIVQYFHKAYNVVFLQPPDVSKSSSSNIPLMWQSTAIEYIVKYIYAVWCQKSTNISHFKEICWGISTQDVTRWNWYTLFSFGKIYFIQVGCFTNTGMWWIPRMWWTLLTQYL